MLDVIKRPLVTEKLSRLAEQGVYSFEVTRKANKTQIKNTVEKYFDVQVDSIRTIVCRGRSKKTTHGPTRVKYWKKAMVKLKPGEKITLLKVNKIMRRMSLTNQKGKG